MFLDHVEAFPEQHGLGDGPRLLWRDRVGVPRPAARGFRPHDLRNSGAAAHRATHHECQTDESPHLWPPPRTGRNLSGVGATAIPGSNRSYRNCTALRACGKHRKAKTTTGGAAAAMDQRVKDLMSCPRNYSVTITSAS